jgi:hypothetical protein
MPKVITSPITRWPGTVTIADPLNESQAKLIEAGMKQPDAQEGERVWLTVIDSAKLPAVIGCVVKWELENFTPNPFPFSPRGDSHKLIDWIFRELLTVYFGEAIVPNE